MPEADEVVLTPDPPKSFLRFRPSRRAPLCAAPSFVATCANLEVLKKLLGGRTRCCGGCERMLRVITSNPVTGLGPPNGGHRGNSCHRVPRATSTETSSL